ncbi:MAG: hypothetical protein IVW57_08210 [Ktedonobacterales bacterium]|nr:hypothetical protein [Ktedonobacterales bacterium]
MSGKVKMRCGRCGKHFTSAKGAKQIFCDTCAAKERAARAATKGAPTQPVAVAQAPRIVGPGAGILDPRLAPPPMATPPDRGSIGEAARATGGTEHGHTPAAHGHGQTGHTPKARPAASAPPASAPRRAREEQPPRQTTPRPPRQIVPVFTLTDELRQQIEARYLELAQPLEFDGIRTQIAGELHVPKAVVKRTVLELRGRMQLPSWWELKAYSGSESDLARIRAAYVPLLPVPPVGIHKPLAKQLGLEETTVYQGIRRIRAEMHLPRYNPREAHEPEAGEVAAPTGEAAAAPAGGTLGGL